MRNLKKLFKESPFKVSVAHRIPFYDVDMMEVVWYGNYIKYFDIARAKLAIKMGIDYYDFRKIGVLAPVVKCETQYKSYGKYNDDIIINAYFLPQNKMSLKVGYEILAKDNKLLTLGTTEQIFIDNDELILFYNKKLDEIIPENIRQYFIS
jgi:acyl-CoA thioester hydrolase